MRNLLILTLTGVFFILTLAACNSGLVEQVLNQTPFSQSILKEPTSIIAPGEEKKVSTEPADSPATQLAEADQLVLPSAIATATPGAVEATLEPVAPSRSSGSDPAAATLVVEPSTAPQTPTERVQPTDAATQPPSPTAVVTEAQSAPTAQPSPAATQPVSATTELPSPAATQPASPTTVTTEPQSGSPAMPAPTEAATTTQSTDRSAVAGPLSQAALSSFSVPPVLLQALLAELNAPQDGLVIEALQAVDWPNACFDFIQSEPAACAQVITPGYMGIITHIDHAFEGNPRYAFRSDSTGAKISLIPEAAALTAFKLFQERAAQPEEIEIIKVEPWHWSNTCELTSAPVEPGRICIAIPIPGWRVQAKISGQIFEFHTDVNGKVILPVN